MIPSSPMVLFSLTFLQTQMRKIKKAHNKRDFFLTFFAPFPSHIFLFKKRFHIFNSCFTQSLRWIIWVYSDYLTFFISFGRQSESLEKIGQLDLWGWIWVFHIQAGTTCGAFSQPRMIFVIFRPEKFYFINEIIKSDCFQMSFAEQLVSPGRISSIFGR